MALFIAPGFLAYISVLILIALSIIFYFGPKSVSYSSSLYRLSSFFPMQIWQTKHALVYLRVQHYWRHQCECHDWPWCSHSHDRNGK